MCVRVQSTAVLVCAYWSSFMWVQDRSESQQSPTAGPGDPIQSNSFHTMVQQDWVTALAHSVKGSSDIPLRKPHHSMGKLYGTSNVICNLTGLYRNPYILVLTLAVSHYTIRVWAGIHLLFISFVEIEKEQSLGLSWPSTLSVSVVHHVKSMPKKESTEKSGEQN